RSSCRRITQPQVDKPARTEFAKGLTVLLRQIGAINEQAPQGGKVTGRHLSLWSIVKRERVKIRHACQMQCCGFARFTKADLQLVELAKPGRCQELLGSFRGTGYTAIPSQLQTS